ncbi:hypothetical protein UB43_03410 [Pseudomonas sp. 21]|uniref:hypothetical protein n=1 Tax=Pseudomonas sp. 21 TaxID=1619948 RepID=UPI00061FA4E0|nr:hypothetical protein [Pseudomonas sp. 21]KJK03560.1 hypothetical protein UB43_03410 [Pseudomonas sp. 21]
MQVWINNFDFPLVAALDEEEGEALPLEQTALDQLTAAMSDPADWIVLTLSDETGSPCEIVSYRPGSTVFTPLQREQEGTAAATWPAGTRCRCNLTAQALGNLEECREVIIMEDRANTLEVNRRRGFWYWVPPDAVPLTLNVMGFGGTGGSFRRYPLPRQVIEVWPGGSADQQFLVPMWANDIYFDLPSGSTGSLDDGVYSLTIPASPTGSYLIEIEHYDCPIFRVKNYVGLQTF